jgi:hypothetical protein
VKAQTAGTESATGLSYIRSLYPDLNGKGINIAVIDSGVAYHTSSMGPCSGVNSTAPTSSQCRVVIIIIIINPCKPYLTASAPRLTHWGGGK